MCVHVSVHVCVCVCPQNLNADLEDEEYLRDADFYTPLDMQEEETDNLMMMDAL